MTTETYKATMDRFGEWQFGNLAYGGFAFAELENSADDIRVIIGDDDCPTDWGDCEPTDAERENASSFYVAIVVMEDGEEVYHDGIGGVDVIDLPGYDQQVWEDAAAYALTEYLLDGALEFCEREQRERSYWAARDVVTVCA